MEHAPPMDSRFNINEGFDLSVIILASLLVFPMLGCRHSLLRLLVIFHVLSSGMHIFKHFYLLTLASRGLLPSVLALSVKVVVQEHLFVIYLSTLKVIYSFTFPLMYPLNFLSCTRCLNILGSHV